MNNQEPTNRELMDVNRELMTAIYDLSSAMQAFATNTEKRLSRIESTMVTKDYLDERLSHLTGRIVRKTDALVEQLVAEKSLSRPSADRILAMPPSLESL